MNLIFILVDLKHLRWDGTLKEKLNYDSYLIFFEPLRNIKECFSVYISDGESHILGSSILI